jgi:choline dehydrogenase-like flavoprotein
VRAAGGVAHAPRRIGAHAASTGRTHEHENLWIAGAPAHVSASCCNGTLTFAAMGLRTAAHIAGTAARAATSQPTAS